MKFVAKAKEDGSFSGSFCPYDPDDLSDDVFVFQGKGFLTSTMSVADHESNGPCMFSRRCWELNTVMTPDL